MCSGDLYTENNKFKDKRLNNETTITSSGRSGLPVKYPKKPMVLLS